MEMQSVSVHDRLVQTADADNWKTNTTSKEKFYVPPSLFSYQPSDGIFQTHSYSTCDTPPPLLSSSRRRPPIPPSNQDKNPTESTTTSGLADIRNRTLLFLSLFVPYFRESSLGRCRLMTTLIFTLLRSGLSVIFSYILRDFWTALSDRDPDGFYRSSLYFVLATVGAVPINVLYQYVKDTLTLGWREWMTERCLGLYVRNGVYYAVEAQKKEAEGPPNSRTVEKDSNDLPQKHGTETETEFETENEQIIDNADQRITEDVDAFTSMSLSLLLLFLRSSIDLFFFSFILCSVYPPLLYILLIYATLGTIVTWNLGKVLVPLNVSVQKREADLRFALVRLRERSESIAFYFAGPVEGRHVLGRLSSLVKNYSALIRTQRNLAFFTSLYGYVIQILPAVVVAPLYFRGDVEFGVVSQATGAFYHVLEDMSLVITHFESLTSFGASVGRLGRFLEACRRLDGDREETSGLLEDVGFVGRGDGNGGDGGGDRSGGDGLVTDVKKGGIVLRRDLYPTNRTILQDSGGKTTDVPPSVVLSLSHLTITPFSTTTETAVTDSRFHRRTLIRDLTLDLSSTSSLYITGPSGCGKSSLLRTLAGLWSSGEGVVRSPPKETVFFLPQTPYCSRGTLRDQVLYPNVASHPTNTTALEEGGGYGKAKSDTEIVYNYTTGWYESAPTAVTVISDEEILAVLKLVGLKSLPYRLGNGDPYAGLDAVRDWDGTLSTGERQRLGFARVWTNNASLVVLDESTSALDMEAEDSLYRLLQEMSIARNFSYISVGHRPSLLKYHDRKLTISRRRGEWTLEDCSTGNGINASVNVESAD